MRIYTKGSPQGHNGGKPYIDIEPSIHGVNLLFSDPTGYYINRREEISTTEILTAIYEIIERPYKERKF